MKHLLLLVRQHHLRDWPKVIWLRIRYCMYSGHEYGFDDSTYCTTCGAPWTKPA